jgi:hypothetical protein
MIISHPERAMTDPTIFGSLLLGLQVRILLGSPVYLLVNKTLFARFGFVLSPFLCCKTMRADTKEINGLETPTNHSAQHGRNITVHFPFAFRGGLIFGTFGGSKTFRSRFRLVCGMATHPINDYYVRTYRQVERPRSLGLGDTPQEHAVGH